MNGEHVDVPRDLSRRLADLTDATDGRAYGELVAGTRALPPRDQLPPCRACGHPLKVRSVLVSGGDVAVAVRLVCNRTDEHDSGQGLQYVYELATRDLYLESHEPVGERVTLTVPQLRRALDRAADGESVDALVAECRGNSV